MIDKLFNWQKEIIERVSRMSNLELLDETLSMAQGDDYDGCFTKRGAWEFDCLNRELRERLADWLGIERKQG